MSIEVDIILGKWGGRPTGDSRRTGAEADRLACERKSASPHEVPWWFQRQKEALMQPKVAKGWTGVGKTKERTSACHELVLILFIRWHDLTGSTIGSTFTASRCRNDGEDG